MEEKKLAISKADGKRSQKKLRGALAENREGLRDPFRDDSNGRRAHFATKKRQAVREIKEASNVDLP